MDKFVFDREIFKRKFIKGDSIQNRAKNTFAGLDSICPNDSNSKNTYQGYKSNELLSDTLHNILGVVVDEKKEIDVETALFAEINNQVSFKSEKARGVFMDLMRTMYFEGESDGETSTLSLLRYQGASKQKDFGKFVVDVLMDDATKSKFLEMIENSGNSLDDIVNKTYKQLNMFKYLKKDREYTPIFREEMKSLYSVMNQDFRNVLDNRADWIFEMEFLISYYTFIYLSQIAILFDSDIEERKKKLSFPLFKGAKEAVSIDRDCVAEGWGKIERKTKKIFKHLVVLNMLNCHDNSIPYYTYSELYKLYRENNNLREDMDIAIDFLIDQYTRQHQYDSDIPGEGVHFEEIEYDEDKTDPCKNYKLKVKYLYDCVSLQLERKKARRDVVSYIASNYNHVLKMRFVKSWGQLGHMIMISNDDLILMIKICQSSSDKIDLERGIQIRDLFYEFEARGLCMDGKTQQYIINYLRDINLIDSKCDSEEAQYVKRIQ